MDDLSIALQAAKSASKWYFVNNYAGGPKTIKCRDPDDRALWYVSLHSWDFVRAAGCSSAAARRRCGALADRGLIVEKRRFGRVRDWAPNKPDAERIAREIIAELRAEGLPFDDEWRAAGSPRTWPKEAEDV